MILASLIGHQVGGYFLSMSIGHQIGGFFYNIQNKRNTTASCILHWYVKSPSHQGMPDAYQEKIVLQLLHPSVLLRVMRPNPCQRSNRTQALTCLHEQMPLFDFDGIVLLLHHIFFVCDHAVAIYECWYISTHFCVLVLFHKWDNSSFCLFH